MKRKLEPVDLSVAVGLFATIVGACSFFIAANGGLSGSAQETNSPPSEVTSARQWVQPALGQSIVEEAVLSRKALARTRAAAFELIEALGMSAQFQQPPSGYLKSIVMRARIADEEQAAQVQYVLGQMIVHFTGRGLRAEPLSTSLPDMVYTRRWIEIARVTAERMNADFQAHREANLGEAIVAASVTNARSNEQTQERLGAAVVRMAQVQDTYREASQAAEVQTAAVIMAALRTEALDGLLRELAGAEPTGEKSVPYVAARTLPEIPVSILVAGSAAAILIFFVGLMVPSKNQEVDVAASYEEKDASSYRRAG